ncbi:MAG: GNAT family N-acetyltransferase [Chloroflexota bacterium]|nr:GNAT family N-acetyltransferase [Chloroflexota bacterium]
MDSLVIRRAVAEDIETIGQLWEQLVEHHTHLDTRLPESVPNGGRRYARRLYDTLRDDYARLLVAVVNDKVIGYVLGMIVDLAPDMFEQETSGFLADIFVTPEQRRTGAGRALVQELARWFRERGVQYYEWHVAARNADALAFWESIGGDAIMVRMRASVNE